MKPILKLLALGLVAALSMAGAGQAAAAGAKSAVVSGRTAKFEITAQSFSKAKEWTKNPKAGYSYYVLTYQVKNLSTKAQKRDRCPDVNNFEYSDKDGMLGIWAKYTGVRPDTSKLKLPGDTVGAGERYQDTVVFEVADSINPVKVFYRASTYAKSQPLFSLSK